MKKLVLPTLLGAILATASLSSTAADPRPERRGDTPQPPRGEFRPGEQPRKESRPAEGNRGEGDRGEARPGDNNRGGFDFMQELNEEQRGVFRDLMEEMREAGRTTGEKMQQARRELNEAMFADKFDEKLVREKAAEVVRLEVDSAVSRGRALAKVRGKLPADVFERLKPMLMGGMGPRPGGPGGPQGGEFRRPPGPGEGFDPQRRPNPEGGDFRRPPGGGDRGPRPDGDRGPRPDGDRGPRPDGDRAPQPQPQPRIDRE